MSRKSLTCFNKINGRPLSEYFSRTEALENAVYAKKKFGQNLIPYKCRKCGKPLMDDFIEKKIGDDICRFCSDECVDKYAEEKSE